MKKILLLFVLFNSSYCFSQGAAISWKKKIETPIVINSNDTIQVDDEIKVLLGANPDGSFRFVQLLNGMNEPIKSADSRASMVKQKIKFFKASDDVFYAFTKYFAVNLEAALLANEIQIIKSKSSK